MPDEFVHLHTLEGQQLEVKSAHKSVPARRDGLRPATGRGNKSKPGSGVGVSRTNPSPSAGMYAVDFAVRPEKLPRPGNLGYKPECNATTPARTGQTPDTDETDGNVMCCYMIVQSAPGIRAIPGLVVVLIGFP